MTIAPIDSAEADRILSDIVRQLPLRGKLVMGSAGYSAPRFGGKAVPIPAEEAEELARYGIKLEGEPGTDNVVIVDPAQQGLSLTLRIRGCSGTRILLGHGAPFSGRFAFNGHGSALIVAGFGEMGGASQFNLTLGPGCAAYLGAGLTSVSSNWIIEGEDRSLIIGDDLMASWGVSVRNFDSHALFDIESEAIINSAADLHIGPHCWLGQDAKILRGVAVGPGAIVGAGAVVVGEVPSCSAVAGAPAKAVRSGVSWTRSPQPSKAELARVKSLLSELGG